MSIPSFRARRTSGARAAGSAPPADHGSLDGAGNRTRRAPVHPKLLAAAGTGVVVALLACGGGTAAAPGGGTDAAPGVESVATSAPTVHRVEMRGFAFVPSELSVAGGDTIVWMNADPVPHTATSLDGSWDTGTVAAGDSASVVVQGPGSYVCTFHPSMTGRMVAASR